jgi:hypothetical protein
MYGKHITYYELRLKFTRFDSSLAANSWQPKSIVHRTRMQLPLPVPGCLLQIFLQGKFSR